MKDFISITNNQKRIALTAIASKVYKALLFNHIQVVKIFSKNLDRF